MGNALGRRSGFGFLHRVPGRERTGLGSAWIDGACRRQRCYADGNGGFLELKYDTHSQCRQRRPSDLKVLGLSSTCAMELFMVMPFNLNSMAPIPLHS